MSNIHIQNICIYKKLKCHKLLHNINVMLYNVNYKIVEK